MMGWGWGSGFGEWVVLISFPPPLPVSCPLFISEVSLGLLPLKTSVLPRTPCPSFLGAPRFRRSCGAQPPLDFPCSLCLLASLLG